MIVLTPPECEQWLASRHDSCAIEAVLAERFPSPRVLSLPGDAHKRTHVARTLAHAVDPEADGLLWITAWGIFPSAENMALFDAYRRSLGETRSVRDAPGHAFARDDRGRLECILDLVLYFFWDATLVSTTAAARLSHDEWLELHGGDAWLDELALEPLGG